MEFLNDYGLFVAKIITALAALGVLAAIIGNASSTKSKIKGHLEISSLNDDLEKINTEFVASLVPPHNKKAFKKTQKKAEKKLACCYDGWARKRELSRHIRFDDFPVVMA